MLNFIRLILMFGTIVFVALTLIGSLLMGIFNCSADAAMGMSIFIIIAFIVLTTKSANEGGN